VLRNGVDIRPIETSSRLKIIEIAWTRIENDRHGNTRFLVGLSRSKESTNCDFSLRERSEARLALGEINAVLHVDHCRPRSFTEGTRQTVLTASRPRLGAGQLLVTWTNRPELRNC